MNKEKIKEPTCIWTKIVFVLLVLVEFIVRRPHTWTLRINLGDIRLELVQLPQHLSFLLPIKPHNLLELTIQQRREHVVRWVPTTTTTGCRTSSQPEPVAYIATEKGRAFVSRSFKVVYPAIHASILLFQGIDVLLERRVPKKRETRVELTEAVETAANQVAPGDDPGCMKTLKGMKKDQKNDQRTQYIPPTILQLH